MSDPEYYVIRRRPCPECGGDGKIEAPVWAQYWAWYNARTRTPTRERRLAWWANHGFRILPSEQLACATCEGTGRLECEVRLEEALQALGIHHTPAPLEHTSGPAWGRELT